MHVVIIGNGIAGTTAARELRKRSDCRITVISKETDYFFSRTALMYVYMGHLKFEHTQPYENWFWQKNKIELVRGTIESVDFAQRKLFLSADSQTVIYQPTLLERLTKVASKPTTSASQVRELSYDKLIIATGSVPRFGDWSKTHLEGVQGLYSFQDLEKLERSSAGVKQAVIVGGGLIGVELAEMLHSRGIHVTMLVRESSYWRSVLPPEESALVTQHVQKRGIDLRFGCELKEMQGTQRVERVITSQDETIDCQLVGISIGVEPNIDFLRTTSLETQRGILVNEYLETNLPDVYAVGDCVEHRTPPQGRKSVEQIWYTGRIMGETVAQTIGGQRTPYQPGVFFNSAKFFDLEYQTYGEVPAQCPDGIQSFYWQHPSKEIAIRINYRQDTRAVTGFNALGTRLRHATCDAWIRQQRSLDYVLEHFQEADFNPEFFEKLRLSH
ncbi:NAD(P)/FAD-dependent oxidoreductase [Runella sp. SP2]|uniref:NAD(P)/FAD-dependent oxidoreductase n=1 Tax=Runella sp. SP2 TaxID=2268026 RepID=UPI000F08B6FE|nr:NAD(P)/FAD-dependent oxidoreductase [Runella sp. SP2]AYQ35563.1 NAD(P)/FAD-dependent oxidoreductase [Runella sp. SP2]